MEHHYPIAEGRCGDVSLRLTDGVLVDIDSRNLRIRKTLSHHEGNDAGACAHIQNSPATTGPGTQQNTIGANFHRTEVLTNGKLLELEHGKG